MNEDQAHSSNGPETGLRGGPEGSVPRSLLPQDSAKLLVELLQPAGIELGRRWLAALLHVPQEEREAVVESVEAEIMKTYPYDEA